LSRTTSESVGGSVTGGPTPVTDSDTTALGVAISGLFYVARKDSLRPYVSPRFTYSRTSVSGTTDNGTIIGPTTTDSVVSSYAGSLSFGAQYSLGRRFGVFGELGGSYARINTASTSTFTIATSTFINGAIVQATSAQVVRGSSAQNQYSTRAALGVIVFF
jgi:hypothetical protein